ncbi:MAG: DNA topoisomerase III [Clostridia bacterium]|jgi:DNA topoisomerase-3
MGKILVIAEKPSVGRDIARVLGCRTKGEGFLEGDRYIVTWAIGHLVTLAEPEDYDPVYKSWRLDTLPILPSKMKLKPISKTRKQYAIVKKLMNAREVEELICATDSGREGELIFRYIYQMAGCKKPFRRLWISSMTDTAIREGFERLKPGEEYDTLYISARCRSEADWLVGMNASRAFSIQYKALLSIGRVQTPTLSLLVERQKKIQSFVPQDYWEITGNFGDYEGTWFDPKTKDTRMFDREKAEALAARLRGETATVLQVEREEKKQLPPLLYDLTELQRDGNRRFGFSAQKTLSIAQDLYEKRKLLTYPRTDSRYLSRDMIPKLRGILQKVGAGPYQQYAQALLELAQLPINKRIVNDERVTDHHAIIPTETLPKLQSLTADERKIYDLVVRRFLAVFYPAHVYLQTRIITGVEGESFISKGRTVLKQGWRVIYREDEKPEKEEEKELPPLEKGAVRTLERTQIEQKQTTPPKPYNEATLLSAMENVGRLVEDEELRGQMKENGLGTPATRAAIIERLLEVGYVERKGKSLIPTEKGMKLIEIVPSELKTPEMTGKWEKGLTSIARGKMQGDAFMESIVRYVRYIVQQARQVNPAVQFEREEKGKRRSRGKRAGRAPSDLGKCPACKKGRILENSKAFYCTEWKKGCSFTIWKNALEKQGISITAEMVRELLAKGRTEKRPLGKSEGRGSDLFSLVLQDERGQLKLER